MPLDKILNSGTGSTALTGALSGAAGGALVSAFTNKKSAGKLLKAGGLVALGGIAWQAFQKYKAGQAAPEELTREDFDNVVSADAADENNNAALVLQAMIAAGYADGHLSDVEQQKIWQHALDGGVSQIALNELSDLLANPVTVEQIAAGAVNLQTKIEVYSASLLAIDEQCAAGQAHLQKLAGALSLPAPLVQALHSGDNSVLAA